MECEHIQHKHIAIWEMSGRVDIYQSVVYSVVFFCFISNCNEALFSVVFSPFVIHLNIYFQWILIWIFLHVFFFRFIWCSFISLALICTLHLCLIFPFGHFSFNVCISYAVFLCALLPFQRRFDFFLLFITIAITVCICLFISYEKKKILFFYRLQWRYGDGNKYVLYTKNWELTNATKLVDLNWKI